MTAPPVLPGGPDPRPTSIPESEKGIRADGSSPLVLRAWVLAMVGLSILIGLALLWSHKPEGQIFFPRCAFHEWTGLQCPGCGGLRATHALLHGNVAEAWRLNALYVASLPLVAWTILALLIERWSGLKPPHPLGFRHLWLVLVIVILGFGLLRNL